MAIPYSYTPIYVSIYIHGTPILPLIAMQIYAKFRDIYALKGKEMGFHKKVFYTFYADFKYYGKPDLKKCAGLINRNIKFSFVKNYFDNQKYK